MGIEPIRRFRHPAVRPSDEQGLDAPGLSSPSIEYGSGRPASMGSTFYDWHPLKESNFRKQRSKRRHRVHRRGFGTVSRIRTRSLHLMRVML